MVYYLNEQKDSTKIEAAIDLDHVTEVEYACDTGDAVLPPSVPTERAFTLVLEGGAELLVSASSV